MGCVYLFLSVLCHFIECDWVISRRGPIRWDAGICILFARPQQICDRCLLMLENDLLTRPTDFKSLLIHYCKMVLKQVVSKIGTSLPYFGVKLSRVCLKETYS